MIRAGAACCGGFSESSIRGLRNGPTGSGWVVFPPDPEVGFVSGGRGEYADNGGRPAGKQALDLVVASWS